MRERLDAMARAVEANWCAAWASLGAVTQEPRVYVDETPHFLRVYSPTCEDSLLNLVMRYAAPGPLPPGAVESVLVPYRTHRIPMQWWLLRGTEPAGLRSQLQEIGMQSWGGAPAMALPLATWQPRVAPAQGAPHLTRATTRVEREEALEVICTVFGVARRPMALWTVHNVAFTLYLARLGGRAVAALATLLSGETVGLYHVATLPGARRRGIAGNLLVQALMEARAAGAHCATLTATPEAQSLYEQLGFQTCGQLEQWTPGPQLALALRHGLPLRRMPPPPF